MFKEEDLKKFENEVKELVGDEYSVVNNYKSSNEYIYIKHNTCGSINKIKPNWFLGGNRCYKCSWLMRKSDEEFKKAAYCFTQTNSIPNN